MKWYYVHLDFAGAVQADSREEAEAKAKEIVVTRLHTEGSYLLDLSPVRAEVTESEDDNYDDDDGDDDGFEHFYEATARALAWSRDAKSREEILERLGIDNTCFASVSGWVAGMVGFHESDSDQIAARLTSTLLIGVMIGMEYQELDALDALDALEADER